LLHFLIFVFVLFVFLLFFRCSFYIFVDVFAFKGRIKLLRALMLQGLP
jgi:hypothetical protein